MNHRLQFEGEGNPEPGTARCDPDLVTIFSAEHTTSSDEEEEVVNEIAEDMVQMASQLKQSAQIASDTVNGDNKVYDHFPLLRDMVINTPRVDHGGDSFPANCREGEDRN